MSPTKAPSIRVHKGIHVWLRERKSSLLMISPGKIFATIQMHIVITAELNQIIMPPMRGVLVSFSLCSSLKTVGLSAVQRYFAASFLPHFVRIKDIGQNRRYKIPKINAPTAGKKTFTISIIILNNSTYWLIYFMLASTKLGNIGESALLG